MLIPLKEYAAAHGFPDNTARKRAARGSFKTAVKMGRDWFIDSEEPWIDNRLKICLKIITAMTKMMKMTMIKFCM